MHQIHKLFSNFLVRDVFQSSSPDWSDVAQLQSMIIQYLDIKTENYIYILLLFPLLVV